MRDMRRSGGFSLIELVIVMLVISVGLLGLTPLFSSTSTSLTTNETLQRAAQYAQQCAEQALAARRQSTLIAFAIPASCIGTTDGFDRTATAGAIYPSTAGTCSGTSTCPCPVSGTINCRNVAITVTKGSLSSSVTLMLTDYTDN